MGYKFVVLFLAGVAFLFGLVYVVGLDDVLAELSEFSLEDFAILFAIQVLLMTLYAFKWFVVLRHMNVSFRSVLPVSFVGYLVNNLTPVSGAGGEPVRAYILPKVDKNISTEKAAASVIVDLLLEISPLLLLIVLTIILTVKNHFSNQIALILGVIGLFLMGFFFAIMNLSMNKQFSRNSIQAIIKFTARIPVSFLREHALDAEKRLENIFSNFHDAMRETMTNNFILFSSTILSAVIWCISLLRVYLIFLMLGIKIPLLTLLIVRVTLVAVGFLPLLPGGIGTWEGASTWLYSFFGISAPAAMAATLMERLFSFWIGSLIGLFATAYLGLGYVLDKFIKN